MTEYPTKAYDGTCAYKEIGDVQVSAFTDVTFKSPSALMVAVSDSPVLITIDTSGIALELYRDGCIEILLWYLPRSQCPPCCLWCR